MTAVYDYIIDTGIIVADTSTILADVQGEWVIALGSSLNLAASTPQGTLIANEVIARTAVMKNNADVANLLNPNQSYGVYLDAICSFLGQTRGTNQSTIGVGVTITGNPLTVIAAGSRVETANNDVFVTVGAITIPSGGTTTATLQSQAFGPVALPAGVLTILDGTIGWAAATVTGGTSVVLGTLALQDPQLKNQRTQTLFTQGVGSSGAIYSNVLEVPNVTSAFVVENNTGTVTTVNGVTFTMPNAMWACVAGTATQAAIAQALYNAHGGGCPWDYGTGGTPVNSPNGVSVIDPYTGLTYNVKYTTPVMYDAYVNITIHQGTSVSAPIPSVQNAILNYAGGEEQGELGLVVGANVSAFEMAGAVARQLPGIYVKNCQVACVPAGSPPPTYPSDYVTEFVLNPFWQAKLQLNNVTVQQV